MSVTQTISKKPQHILLDFSHVYDDERLAGLKMVHWEDCSNIAECDLYCSDRAAREIWAHICPHGIGGVHFLDSGNYHYVTKIITDHIQEPFVLLVFDHHTDMQQPLIEDMISCGDWAGKVLQENDRLGQLILMGPQKADLDAISPDADGSSRLLTFSEEELHRAPDTKKLKKIRRDLPVYISIDKDVLDVRYSETNWSQGDMSLDRLEDILWPVLKGARVLGIDICGECQQGTPLPEYLEAEKINGETNSELFSFIRSCMYKEKPDCAENKKQNPAERK